MNMEEVKRVCDNIRIAPVESLDDQDLADLAVEHQAQELKQRPLQPFEDYYKTIRGYIAGYRAAETRILGEK